MKTEKNQCSDQIIDITNWLPDEQYNGIFIKGARDKSILYCPEDAPYDFLVKNKGVPFRHKYIYKLSSRRYVGQFWMEIVAYKIGLFMRVNVPPSFVAMNTKDNTCGVLMEYFFRDYSFYDEEENEYFDRENYKDGGWFMKKLIPNFDSKKGKQHNWLDVMRVGAVTKTNKGSWINEWAKIFIFDATIGNIDRHQDNWGIIEKNKNNKPKIISISPAFDNGTSLGNEILEKKFYRFDDPRYLLNYIKKGPFHMKWDRMDTEKMRALDFILKFVKKYPEHITEMLKCLDFSVEELYKQLIQLIEFDVAEPLSKNRVDFMINLISKRQGILKNILEGC